MEEISTSMENIVNEFKVIITLEFTVQEEKRETILLNFIDKKEFTFDECYEMMRKR